MVALFHCPACRPLGIRPIVALVTTDTSPIPPEVSTMTNRTSMQSVRCIRAVATGRTVAVRMSAGPVVAGVARDAAPTALVGGAVTVAAIEGTINNDWCAVIAARRPTHRMTAGAIVAGVATLAAGAALVIDAVTLGAIAGTVGAHFSAMGAGFGPTRGMAAIGTIMALEARGA